MEGTPPDFSTSIAGSLSLPRNNVASCLQLLSEGATLPFISRYRKERTGGMDEVQIAAVQTLNENLTALWKRKITILASIEKASALTPELQQRIDSCWDAAEIEDLYLPYKPKRKTRAEVARQRGLEPLANILMAQREPDPEVRAKTFVGNEVQTVSDALKGACDIVAERISEDARVRKCIRHLFRSEALISAKVIKGKEADGHKYADYFDFSEPLRRCQAHRLLALRRGEAEGILRVHIQPDEQIGIDKLNRLYLKGRSGCTPYIKESVADAYKRLIAPSVETEFATDSKRRADEEAIKVFVINLRQLLLASPLGHKRVMGIDPGFRTGCKVVCLDEQGGLLYHTVVFPHPPRDDRDRAGRSVLQLVGQYRVEAIAVGNGTAGRETEDFIKALPFDRPIDVFAVSEDGASVYSASVTAREEFPDLDVTVRGAVSIARRLIDPLAELVKIDPKSIGVGQYQHDVDQTLLKQQLDQTVVSCVNAVGVNLNTASYHLLAYVSGLGPKLARGIVDYRIEHGPFTSRRQLLDVPRMGTKTFEQCAAFLRIPGADNPLDNSAVHPERYALVERMARDMHTSVRELIGQKALRQRIDLQAYVTPDCGLPTLNDIMAELDKPGRDPRSMAQPFAFDPTVRTIDDMKVGAVLPGVVTNITNFGCFVDIGIHEKGLVHISQMADTFVSDPSQVVALHQQVQVRVLSVDKERNRIALSLKKQS